MNETVLYEPFKTVPLSKFHPELQFEFPDLPEQLFDFALIRAARTIAKDGKVLQRRCVIHPQPNVCRYALRSPDGLELVAVLSIRHDTPCRTHYVRQSFVAPESSVCCDRHRAWYDDLEECLHIQTPYLNSIYYVTIAVTPPDAVCDLPAIYYDEYLDLLLLGAKARILRMNNKPWTNLQLAVAYDRSFAEGIQTAAVDTLVHSQTGFIKMQFGRIL